MEDVSVSRTSVSRYRCYFLDYYTEILSKSLLFEYDYDLTDFFRVAIDGTKIKACNSSFNYITKKDLRRLLCILKNKRYGKEDVLLLKNLLNNFIIMVI